jgi:hypothetical protein
VLRLWEIPGNSVLGLFFFFLLSLALQFLLKWKGGTEASPENRQQDE